MRDVEPTHILIVPPTGILEIVHTDHGIDVPGTLADRCEGVLVTVHHEDLEAAWLVDDAGQLNPRARWVWHQLTGANMVFTGHVIFTGVDTHTMVDLMSRLS